MDVKTTHDWRINSSYVCFFNSGSSVQAKYNF
ncbi:MAG: hypothetical protein ACI8ZB_005522 [Desulforhopalus sp.]